MGWTGFAVAFGAFFLTHSVPLRPPVRAWFVGRLGRRAFSAGYSVLSLLVLAWLIVAARRAPFLEVWAWAPWQSHLALALMLPVCVLLGLSVGRPNPLSFGGPSAGFDPERPGVVRLTRHPVLLALALWATAHLLANGDLAHVLLFGFFTVFALFGRRLVDRRKRREMGEIGWIVMRRQIERAPLRPEPWRVAAGVALYAVLVALHPLIIGVSPLAF